MPNKLNYLSLLAGTTVTSTIMVKIKQGKATTTAKKQIEGSTKKAKGNSLTQGGSWKQPASDGSDNNPNSSVMEPPRWVKKKLKHAELEVVEVEESDMAQEPKEVILSNEEYNDEVCQWLNLA